VVELRPLKDSADETQCLRGHRIPPTTWFAALLSTRTTRWRIDGFCCRRAGAFAHGPCSTCTMRVRLGGSKRALQ
jgi:hypothetical protein